MGTKYVPLNPGSSFRGLHDSLVNHGGNRDPQLLLCLHEEIAVSLAHGYAKATGDLGGGGRARPGRAHARLDGRLRRVLRPHAAARARRQRPDGPRAAPSRRLDPLRHHPGPAGPRLRASGTPSPPRPPPRSPTWCAPASARCPPRRARPTCRLDAGVQEAELPAPLELPDLALHAPAPADRAPTPPRSPGPPRSAGRRRAPGRRRRAGGPRPARDRRPRRPGGAARRGVPRRPQRGRLPHRARR